MTTTQRIAQEIVQTDRQYRDGTLCYEAYWERIEYLELMHRIWTTLEG